MNKDERSYRTEKSMLNPANSLVNGQDQEGDQPPESVKEFITPEIAVQYLKQNKNNRRLRLYLVDKLVRDILSGNWKLTHQGIAFDKAGNLLDGQHRLEAIIQAGVGIEIFVTRNLEAPVVLAIDCGTGRTGADALHYQGKSPSTREVAIANLLATGVSGNKKLTRSELIESYYRHEEAITAIVSHFPTVKKGIVVAAVLTPLTRAWYTVNRDKLYRFADVLHTGMGDETEKTIIQLRESLLNHSGRNNYLDQKDIYLKTERALLAHLAGQQLTLIRPCTKEMFPLPGDE